MSNWVDQQDIFTKCKPAAGDQSVLVIGDSITKGVYYDEQRGRHALLKNGFCSLLCERLQLAVENLSRFGCTTQSALQILKSRLQKGPRPALVLLELGGNDCDYHWDDIAKTPEAEHMPFTPLEQYGENLREMVECVKAAGSQPIVCNLPPIDADRYFRFFTGNNADKGAQILKWLGEVGRIYWWHERYNAMAEYIAQLTRTPLIMLRRALLSAYDYRRFVSPDGIHPNAEGHARMAELVLEDVRRFAPSLLPA